jgi:hypothetical protein
LFRKKILFLLNYFIFLERVFNSFFVLEIILIPRRLPGDLGATWGLALDGGIGLVNLVSYDRAEAGHFIHNLAEEVFHGLKVVFHCQYLVDGVLCLNQFHS